MIRWRARSSTVAGPTYSPMPASSKPALRAARRRSGPSLSSHAPTQSNNLLSVSDVTHTAQVHFVCNYDLADCHFGNDGFGGTLVTDPPVAQETFAAQLASAVASTPADRGAVIADTTG